MLLALGRYPDLSAAKPEPGLRIVPEAA
jgi:hypothetical protein